MAHSRSSSGLACHRPAIRDKLSLAEPTTPSLHGSLVTNHRPSGKLASTTLHSQETWLAALVTNRQPEYPQRNKACETFYLFSQRTFSANLALPSPKLFYSYLYFFLGGDHNPAAAGCWRQARGRRTRKKGSLAGDQGGRQEKNPPLAKTLAPWRLTGDHSNGTLVAMQRALQKMCATGLSVDDSSQLFPWV